MALWSKIVLSLEQGEPCVVVTVENAEGSTPREAGAAMAITQRGYYGTIGGGTLEWHAMAEAQSLLGKAAARKTIVKILGPDLGQCCGGRVTLHLQSLMREDLKFARDKAEIEKFSVEAESLHIGLFGAGHVARALVLATANLPIRISWWDERPGSFPAVVPHNVSGLSGPFNFDNQDAVLIMTHSHSLDFSLVDAALRQSHISFVGLIGSDTKRVRFLNRLHGAGHDEFVLRRLHCPIGVAKFAAKEPAIIAASVAVQLLQWREAVNSVKMAENQTKSARG